MSITGDLKDVSSSELRSALEIVSVPSRSADATFSNWAQTFTCRPERVFEPTTVLQVRKIVELARREGATVHPVGVGHSPSDLACTNGWLMRMGGVKGVTKIEQEKRSATFYSGTVLHQIHTILASADPPLALPNIGSISDQTLGGLISTASHGSGVNFPVLSKHVRAMTLVLPLPGAPIVRASPTEDPDLFQASLCGLGATGVMIEIEIEVEEAYRLRETKQSKSVDEVINNLDEIKKSAEHVRMWWYPDGEGFVVGKADRTYQPAHPTTSLLGHILGYHVTQFFLFISRYITSFTPWVGKWAYYLAKEDSVVVDDGHKVLNFDCLFPQYTLEWALPSANTKACLIELRNWLDAERADPNGIRPHFPIEIRWTCGDDVWLSPSYGMETTWIGVVTFRPYGLPVPYRKLQERFASILHAHNGRPHWAKEHGLRPKEIEHMYPRFDDFKRVLQRVDPDGVLRSEYIRRHMEGEKIDERLFKKRSL